MPTADQIVADPEWTPLGYDRNRSAIFFAKISRKDASRAAFLDQRAEAAFKDRAFVPLADVYPRALKPAAPAAFIFHTSFCCSTLLARALDVEGRVLALKEPNVLLDVANALRADETLKRDGATAARLVDSVFNLLARPARGETGALIKPTNAANNLLDRAVGSGAPTLLIYGPLRDYLVSIIKKGEEGRAFVRQQFNIFMFDGGGLGAIPGRQALGFTDLQIAALVWRHQIEAFARALAAFPQARLASLDYRDLLADPSKALKSASRHLGLEIPDADLDAAAASDIFARNSKFEEQTFDAAAKKSEEEAITRQWGETIDLIGRWAEKLSLGFDVTLPLARRLQHRAINQHRPML